METETLRGLRVYEGSQEYSMSRIHQITEYEVGRCTVIEVPNVILLYDVQQ